MTPERVAELVAGWVRFYTRGLPAHLARRRIEEIGADLHDHIAYERARGAGDRRIAFGVFSRMVRGLAADAAWRRVRSSKGNSMKPLIAVLAAVLGVAAMVFGEFDDAPGLVLVGLLVIVAVTAFGVRTALRSR